MSPRFDLEILQCILSHFSENVPRDCCRIIDTLLKSLCAPSSTSVINFQEKKTFASVEVLLNLYEKLQEEGKDNLHHSELPTYLIVYSVQYVLQCDQGTCKLPDKDIQYSILSIISFLFKNALLHNNSESLEELLKFYECILMCMYNRSDNKDCKADCLIFRLKIMSCIYHALKTYVPNNLELQDKFKLKNNLNECKLFGELVLYESDDIAIQTLMHLIPEYIMCFKSGRIIQVIWELISDSGSNSVVNYSRVLTVLCKIFDFCFEMSIVSNNENLTVLLLRDSNYWELVQMALVEEDPLRRKQGHYLFKKAIDVLNKTCKNIECCKEKVVFYWNENCKNELYKIYSEIIITLEFLEEQQVHIIKPVFGMIETLTRKIIECDKVSFSWILLVHKKALMHDSIQIVKWGLSSLLKLSEDFFSHEYVAEETVQLLITALTNMNLYYNDSQGITKELKDFFNKLIDLNISKKFFTLFIKCLCRQVWSAETLFFVAHSLSEVKSCSSEKRFWGQEEISEIKEFVSKAFKTHNKIIRTAVQCELLQAVSHLTDHKDVPLENLILLISRFSVGEILAFGNPAWNTFINWLRRSYVEQDFKNVVEKYQKGELDKEFNEKCMSLIFILSYSFKFISSSNSDAGVDDDGSAFKMDYLKEMLISFKEIDKRLYCNKSMQDQYLSIFTHIYEANMNSCISGLIEFTLPFARDCILYIQIQLQQLSGLQDFNACQLYLKAFENIIKTLVWFRANDDIEYINDLYVTVLKDLEVACVKSESCIAMYSKVKLLSAILELCALKPKSSFLDSYLIKKVNEPLKKDNDYSKQTRDSQTLWGRMNSEFLEGKWKILERLLEVKLITYGPLKVEGVIWINDDNLVKLCLDALSSGGYGVLCPVMSVLRNLLPVLKSDLEVRKIVESVWKVISERRKTEEFKLFIKNFVEMLFQEALIIKGDIVQEILLEYADLIFSDSSLTVVNIFMKHIQQINMPDSSVTLFCHVLGKGLLFGPVQKRDEKLTNEVCDRIQILEICQARKISDFNLSQEIRGRAVQKILMLDKNLETHKTIVKTLIGTLLKMESEINKNRVRYFGDSHTHRVKHRLMQALLLLEPALDTNEKHARELLEWVLDCLVSENSQPSVRYMQEWLLIRMLLRHFEEYSRFSISNYYFNEVEVSKKTLCSLLVVEFHICQLIPLSIMEERISSSLENILYLCFHQHFEVRLYAQVVFMRLYLFAKSQKFDRILKNFENIYINFDALLSDAKGNFTKNVFKLTEDFFLTSFKPLEHYSLETIYTDLPRLTNAGPDERISVETFQYCGVDSYKMGIPLTNQCVSLKSVSDSEHFKKKFTSDMSTVSGDLRSEEILANYQKKVIPRKPLIPVWDESGAGQQWDVKKDGLVVVASLIDRIPNLGGLARTCEIFGASEFVINSFKYTEDKQFTSLSVTAEKWLPVKEVKAQNLLGYVLEMKQNGYTVIGAEQALHSLPLSAVNFPKKSLLLLGNEKEGIPPNLLPVLDLCVEIPQLGIIRSLNVHVTGALFIWEYAKQNLFYN